MSTIAEAHVGQEIEWESLTGMMHRRILQREDVGSEFHACILGFPVNGANPITDEDVGRLRRIVDIDGSPQFSDPLPRDWRKYWNPDGTGLKDGPYTHIRITHFTSPQVPVGVDLAKPECKWQEGGAYTTEDGREAVVYYVHDEKAGGGYPIHGAIVEAPGIWQMRCWALDGQSASGNSALNLVPPTGTITVYVYRTPEGAITVYTAPVPGWTLIESFEREIPA